MSAVAKLPRALRTRDVGRPISHGDEILNPDYEMDTIGLTQHPDGQPHPRSDEEENLNDDDGQRTSELPPVDRGRKAWGYLLGAFLVEAVFIGFPTSFGIFQTYLSTHAPFEGNKSSSLIGTLASGLAYLSGPFMNIIVTRYPKMRRKMMYGGLLLCFTACVAASFATSITQLILTQGAMYGIGVGLLYLPILSLMSEWFVERRGMASGIMFGGAGISGVVGPLIFEQALNKMGYQTTLRIWAGAMVILTAPPIHFLLKGRLPDSQITAARRLNLSFLKNPTFISIAFSNLLQGLAFFIPGIYLPSYAADLSLTSVQYTLVLSLLNLATVFGQVIAGHTSDRWGSLPLMFLSPFVGAGSVCLIWGFSKGFAPLVVFSLVYGASAGGYSVLWTKVAMELASDDPHTQMTIQGVLSFERGIGNIIAGPISAALIGSKIQLSSYAIDRYEPMVLFTGLAMLMSCVSVVGRFTFGNTAVSIRR